MTTGQPVHREGHLRAGGALAARRHKRTARGAAELAVARGRASLVAGVLFGAGVTRTAGRPPTA